ncbi:MAG: hypothetical protein EZS28_013895 [Streblomastix strix]|uniref:Uncharacterized protein n=1 Tax=Streblomastix strix TaxID=222440 RepID=A0A5J4W721_9EUKA|nr:MAG: hypothetical protein EZS28_013895 [Streblomastix strix]
MIPIPNLLRPLASLTIFKLGNHSNQELDRLRQNVRSNSRECLSLIHLYGDAYDFADLVNVEYEKVNCISFSNAGGIGEEFDLGVRNGLNNIYNFLKEQHEGRNRSWQQSFQPLPLLAQRTEEQIEEEGANEEIEAQMNKNGYAGKIKYLTNKAKVEILNHFIHGRRM